jgi:hypothetical protein
MLHNPTAEHQTNTPGIRKMFVELPEDVFKTLKIRCVEQDTSMKALVTQALRHYLGIQEGGEDRQR